MSKTLNIGAAIRAGYRFDYSAGVVGVTAPDGRIGHGATEDDAVLNIGAQILPVVRDDYRGRILIRADGSEIKLDIAGAQ